MNIKPIKKEVPYAKIDEIITEWNKENTLPQGERYTLSQLRELDKRLAPYATLTKPIDSKGNIIGYYSYHTVWDILRRLDPTLHFRYSIVDNNDYIPNIEKECKITGLSISVVYESHLLPVCLQPVESPITNWKNESIAKPSTREVQDTVYRCFVKAIALNTDFGHLQWTKGDWIRNESFKAQHNMISNETSTPNNVMENIIPTTSIGTNGMIAKVKKVSRPAGGVVTPTQNIIPNNNMSNIPMVNVPMVNVTPNNIPSITPIPTPIQNVIPTPIQNVIPQVSTGQPTKGIDLNYTKPTVLPNSIPSPIITPSQKSVNDQAKEQLDAAKAKFLGLTGTDATVKARAIEFFRAKNIEFDFNILTMEDLKYLIGDAN